MFEIFDDQAKVEQVHKLKLVQTYRGIGVAVVDDEGNVIPGGYVCTITQDGTLLVCMGVSKEIGLKIQKGHIMLEI